MFHAKFTIFVIGCLIVVTTAQEVLKGDKRTAAEQKFERAFAYLASTRDLNIDSGFRGILSYPNGHYVTMGTITIQDKNLICKFDLTPGDLLIDCGGTLKKSFPIPRD